MENKIREIIRENIVQGFDEDTGIWMISGINKVAKEITKFMKRKLKKHKHYG